MLWSTGMCGSSAWPRTTCMDALVSREGRMPVAIGLPRPRSLRGSGYPPSLGVMLRSTWADNCSVSVPDSTLPIPSMESSCIICIPHIHVGYVREGCTDSSFSKFFQEILPRVTTPGYLTLPEAASSSITLAMVSRCCLDNFIHNKPKSKASLLSLPLPVSGGVLFSPRGFMSFR